MATYEETIKAIKETYKEYQETLDDLEWVRNRFGCGSEKYKFAEYQSENKWSELHGQIWLACKLFDKKYYPVLMDIKREE